MVNNQFIFADEKLQQEFLDDMIRMSIERNPQYPDTLASSKVPETVEGMLDLARPNIFQRLIDKLKGK